MKRKHRIGSGRTVVLGDPVIVTFKPGEVRWGHYQFPAFSRLPDGRILLQFSDQDDSVSCYGNSPPLYTSSDEGKSWKRYRPESSYLTAPHPVISEVSDGEYLCIPAVRPLDVRKKGIKLPSPAGERFVYVTNLIYRVGDGSKRLQRYFNELEALRWTPKTRAWRRETVKYDIKGALFFMRGPDHRAANLIPRTWIERPLLRLGGELVYADYRRNFALPGGAIPGNCCTAIMVSRDNGRSFRRRSMIACDPAGKDMMGEPMLAQNVRGDLVCVIRRADHNNFKPMLVTISKDVGRTWCKPFPVHDYGVWPSLAMLDCGAMVLAFGRPGVYLSFSLNGIGRKWTKPIPVIPKTGIRKVWEDTCGYTGVLPLGPDEFLLAYSDFRLKDDAGRSGKAIVTRKVKLTNDSRR